jgi:hypothetical protein
MRFQFYEEFGVKRSSAILCSACLSVLVIGIVQIPVGRNQTDSFLDENSNMRVGSWQPDRWQVDFWSGPNMWHDCSMSSEVAYTRFAGWNGFESWGNTEYEQGHDPWKAYGMFNQSVPLTGIQQVSVEFRVVEAKVDSVRGAANAYVDLWINFSQPVGEKGLTWAEFIIYLKTEKGIVYPFQEPGSYSNKIRNDGDLTWYVIGYRCPDVEFGWNTRTININGLTNRLAQSYQVDIAKGTVSCITFGVEAAQGEMSVEWNHLMYEYDF